MIVLKYLNHVCITFLLGYPDSVTSLIPLIKSISLLVQGIYFILRFPAVCLFTRGSPCTFVRNVQSELCQWRKRKSSRPMRVRLAGVTVYMQLLPDSDLSAMQRNVTVIQGNLWQINAFIIIGILILVQKILYDLTVRLLHRRVRQKWRKNFMSLQGKIL